MDQTQKNQEQLKNTKNIQGKPSNVDPKLNHIQSKQRHKNVTNDKSIHNLASIHFDYQRINTILLKWVLV